MNSVLRPFVALAALFLFAQVVQPTTSALLAQLVGASVASVVLIFAWEPRAIWNTVSDVISSRWWSPRHVTVVRMGAVFAAGQLLINATTQIDILLLTVLASPGDVAHYYAAARAALVVSFFFGSSALPEPKLARLFAAGQMDEFKGLLRGTAVIGAAVTVTSCALALILAPYYFELYGPTFEAGMSSLVILVGGLIG